MGQHLLLGTVFFFVLFKPKTKPLGMSEANLKEMKIISNLSYQTLTEKHLYSLCNACNA